ncbi:hypothetical protein OPKNFCMD_1298 [Methylobacterium crusticola]|uniref:DUF2285 domain-containing protein n=2 Tax=Methylobacterium crusticola TaxID=1697972 RepID=A0ABQ4QV88_9HYPH|nr:hypothetical protein OPKNFCMD_1298 [Methylobacterium crusticola]
MLDANERLVWSGLLPVHDDKAAVTFARTMLERHAIEVWDRARFVTRLETPERRRAA